MVPSEINMSVKVQRVEQEGEEGGAEEEEEEEEEFDFL
jgi:hypothetical protein